MCLIDWYMCCLTPAWFVCCSKQYITADRFTTNRNTSIMAECVMYPPRDLSGFLSFLMFNVCFLTIHYTFILPPSKYMVSLHFFFYIVVQEKILFVDVKKSREEITMHYFLAKPCYYSIQTALLIHRKSLQSQCKYFKIFIKILRHATDCVVPPHSIFQSLQIQWNHMQGKYVAGCLNYLSERGKTTLQKEQKRWQDMTGVCTVVLRRRLRPTAEVMIWIKCTLMSWRTLSPYLLKSRNKVNNTEDLFGRK